MEERRREPESTELLAEIAETCGVLNATTGRLVSLLAQVLESGCWQVAGIHSASQWVAWQCGVSPARARSLVAMARRREELVATSTAHEAGELCEDQVAVIARHAPAGVAAQVADLARVSTVTQLRRILGSYPFAGRAAPAHTARGAPQRQLRPERVGVVAPLGRAAPRRGCAGGAGPGGGTR